jgi:hypothetical protein
MQPSPHFRSMGAIALGAFVLSACSPLIPEKDYKAARSGLTESIQQERPGNHYIGRRIYKRDYRFWGYLRVPGQPWSSAKLVIFNEQRTYAPDREMNDLGSDNNHEYIIHGRFSGEKVYEPASNRAFPEFILTGWSLKSDSPPPIFRDRRAIEPSVNLFPDPE